MLTLRPDHACVMTRPSDDIRYEATLLRPKHPGRGGRWSFLVLPKAARAKLPTRGRTFVEGTFNGQPFRAMLEPDGQKIHWLNVDRALQGRAQAEPDPTVTLTLSTDDTPPEPKLPPDLRQALAECPEATSMWSEITCAAPRHSVIVGPDTNKNGPACGAVLR
jgi:hypothetical protein